MHASLIEDICVFLGEFLEIFVHPWLFQSQLHSSNLAEDLIGEEIHQLTGLLKLLTLNWKHTIYHNL